MLPNFYVHAVVPLTDTSVFVDTSYGPLLLDEDDFDNFDFDINWVIDDTNEPYVLEWLCEVKLHYVEQAKKL